MRTLVVTAAAAVVLVLAMAEVGGCVAQAMWRRPATAVSRAGTDRTLDAAARPVLRRLAPVDRVERGRLEQQLARLTDGNVVLDMRALDTLEAAESLVQHWRVNHRDDAHLVCWLAAADDDDRGLLSAVRALSEVGCSALHVALYATQDNTRAKKPT